MNEDRIDRALDQLLAEVVPLEPMQLQEIRAAWDEVDESARRAAWSRVKGILKQTHREWLMNETRDRVRRWIGDVSTLVGVYNLFGTVENARVDMAAARVAAAPAVLDAAAAVICGELLAAEDRALLEGPLRGLEA